MHQKERYNQDKEKGICTRCNKKSETNKTLCTYHLKKASDNVMRAYERKKKLGLCCKCGKIKPDEGWLTCKQCSGSDVRRKKLPSKKVCIRNGLCFVCGGINKHGGYACLDCRDKYINNQKDKRADRIINGLCSLCGKEKAIEKSRKCQKCYDQYYRAYKDRQQKAKLAVIEAYGGKCKCCGEHRKTFLCIDHINNDGNIHRKEINSSAGHSFYKWLIKNNFPDDFQLLCNNCNYSKFVLGGICEHKLGV